MRLYQLSLSFNHQQLDEIYMILIKLCLTIVFHSHNKSMNKEILIDKKEKKKKKELLLIS